jgi:hypothetical protein
MTLESSWRACADGLLAKGDAFDVVIANAGLIATPFGMSRLGHFVLVNRIAALIRSGRRLVFRSADSKDFRWRGIFARRGVISNVPIWLSSWPHVAGIQKTGWGARGFVSCCDSRMVGEQKAEVPAVCVKAGQMSFAKPDAAL